MTPPAGPQRREARRDDPGRPGAEGAVGLGLLAAVALAGVYLHLRPAPNALDRLGFRLQPADVHSGVMIALSHLGSLSVLVGGTLVGTVVAVRRDRLRAVACLAGPLVAVALCELVAKHLVGRQYQEELTYPSGTVTVVASVGTCWALAVPRRARWAVGALAVVLTALAVDTVLALRWHLPTDALAGAALGVGTVLAVDGALQQGWARHVLAALVGRPSRLVRDRQK